MEYYPPNSHKSKEEKQLPDKKVEKVISGKAKTKKKSEMRKFAEVFVPEDTESVKTYIISDLIVPTIKETFLETLRALLGVDSPSGSKKRTAASRVAYQKYYDDRDRRDRRDTRRRTGYDYEDVIVETRADATEVIEGLDDIIEQYGIASVADMYDLAGMSGRYTDNKYGWTDIRSASVIRLGKDEYLIRMPKAMPID